MSLQGKRIILGVTGSIAAYKSVYLLRLLIEAGACVQVILTEGGQKFVAPLTFSTLSQQPVLSNLWDETDDWSKHVKLGNTADLIIIAPCTTQTLFKLAHGACDNLLTAVCLSAACPLLIAPAMDREMYAHPQTQANLQKIQSFGYQIVDSETGFLASGLEGKGRMAEPDAIFEKIKQILAHQKLKGKKILVTAGPTQEPIDAVRYISNHSTGKMGVALAEAAANLGADVTLILGPTYIKPKNAAIKTISTVTALEMFNAAKQFFAEQNVIIMSAAVADYRPKHYSSQKIKKNNPEWSLELEKTEDILLFLGQNKQPGQVLVGFALETNNELENAIGKLKKKNLDYIILNSLQNPNSGFGYDTNQITIIKSDTQIINLPLQSKTKLAYEILDSIYEK